MTARNDVAFEAEPELPGLEAPGSGVAHVKRPIIRSMRVLASFALAGTVVGGAALGWTDIENLHAVSAIIGAGVGVAIMASRSA